MRLHAVVIVRHCILLLHVRKDLAAHLGALSLLRQVDVVVGDLHAHVSLELCSLVGTLAILHESFVDSLRLKSVSFLFLAEALSLDLVQSASLLVELLAKLALLLLGSEDLDSALLANHLQILSQSWYLR